MGINIWVTATRVCDTFIQLVVNEVNEVYGGDDGLFDWADLYQGTDRPAVMTVEQAMAVPDDDSGPWYVVDATDAEHGIHPFIVVTNDGTRSVREEWLPLLQHKGVKHVIFLKARG